MHITLINPNLVVQRNDPMTTGIVYMPVTLASFAGALRREHLSVALIDAFGLAPRQARCRDKFMILGLDAEQVVARIPEDTCVVFIFANQVINHLSLLHIIKAVKERFATMKVGILENAQAVTAYALSPVADELFAHGADFAVIGDLEVAGLGMAQWFLEGHRDIDAVDPGPGILTPRFRNPSRGEVVDIDDLAPPAWDLFPLEQYWSLRFAHGPQSTPRYLPLITSRGCPYPCRFCVAPTTTGRRWRGRAARQVVDDMARAIDQFQVREFHIEDLNPTISDRRIRELCEEIIGRGLDLTWKIVAGTKVESIKDETTVRMMARAGCRYISISPESGAPEMLKAMNKPFKLNHALEIIGHMNRYGIRSQACFVLGFPGEGPEERQKTRQLVRTLTRAGVDEIAVFIITPTPGSELFSRAVGFTSLSDLNFTPVWRPDYAELSRFRKRLYLSFLLWKTFDHPLKIVRQIVNFLRRRFETKMEMVPYRALVWQWIGWTRCSRVKE
ncbi:MAG: B12-binding domain-containing radical SAM protein [Magnetococcales bacterium]|nr:B12-binding domain-containing radical SAM protein [Magnetococcales bacterium]MBF0630219.1 B12-binding domain-containing radical SAM protein [Magnetococcales bacterium]